MHPGLEPRRFAAGSSVAKDMVANLRFDTLSSFGFLSSATSLRKPSTGRFSIAHLSSGAPTKEEETDSFFCAPGTRTSSLRDWFECRGSHSRRLSPRYTRLCRLLAPYDFAQKTVHRTLFFRSPQFGCTKLNEDF